MFHEPEAPHSSRKLYDLCYGIAYTLLPKLLFADPQRTIDYFLAPDFSAGPMIYAMACNMQKIEPSEEAAKAFQSYTGHLSDGREYYIIQYPTPPASSSGSLVGMTVFPFFSAIVRSGPTGETRYFTLGQRPGGGTTLRAVYPDGMNANLGPGPQPELDAFLQALTDGGASPRAAIVSRPRPRR